MQQIGQCFNKQLRTIYQQSTELNALNVLLKTYLKENLRAHCYAGSFNKGRLVIIVDAIWATELRYELPALRDRLRNDAGLYQLIAVDLKIVAELAAEKRSLKTVRKTPPLSPKARQAILNIASTCDYEPLQEALRRLGGELSSTKSNPSVP